MENERSLNDTIKSIGVSTVMALDEVDMFAAATLDGLRRCLSESQRTYVRNRTLDHCRANSWTYLLLNTLCGSKKWMQSF